MEPDSKGAKSESLLKSSIGEKYKNYLDKGLGSSYQKLNSEPAKTAGFESNKVSKDYENELAFKYGNFGLEKSKGPNNKEKLGNQDTYGGDNKGDSYASRYLKMQSILDEKDKLTEYAPSSLTSGKGIKDEEEIRKYPLVREEASKSSTYFPETPVETKDVFDFPTTPARSNLPTQKYSNSASTTINARPLATENEKYLPNYTTEDAIDRFPRRQSELDNETSRYLQNISPTRSNSVRPLEGQTELPETTPTRVTKPSAEETQARYYPPSSSLQPLTYENDENYGEYLPENIPARTRPNRPSVPETDPSYFPDGYPRINQQYEGSYPEYMAPTDYRQVRMKPESEDTYGSKYPQRMPPTAAKPTPAVEYAKYPPSPPENRRKSSTIQGAQYTTATPTKDVAKKTLDPLPPPRSPPKMTPKARPSASEINMKAIPGDAPPPPRSPPKIVPKARPSVSEIDLKATSGEAPRSPPLRKSSSSKKEFPSQSPPRVRSSISENDKQQDYNSRSSISTKLQRSAALEAEIEQPEPLPPEKNDFEDPYGPSRRPSALTRQPAPNDTLEPKVPLSRRNSIINDQPNTNAQPRRSSVKPPIQRKNSSQSINFDKRSTTKSPDKFQPQPPDSYSIAEVPEPSAISSTPVQRPDYPEQTIQPPESRTYQEDSQMDPNSNEIYNTQPASGYPAEPYYDQYPPNYEENSKDLYGQDTYGATGQSQYYDQRYPSDRDPGTYDANYNYHYPPENYPQNYGYDGSYDQPPPQSSYPQQEYSDYYAQQPYGTNYDESTPNPNTPAYGQRQYERPTLPTTTNEPQPEVAERNFVTPYDQYTGEQKEPDRSLNSIDEDGNPISLNESSKGREQESADEVTREVSIEDSSAADSSPSKVADPPPKKEPPPRKSSKNSLPSQSSEERKAKTQSQSSEVPKRTTSRTKITESRLKRMPSTVKSKIVTKKT